MTTSATEALDPATGQEAGRPPRTGGAVAPRRVGGPRRWWDGVLAADPGLGQLQAGWRSLVSITTGLAVGYGMSVLLTLPAMLGMMVGGMMGLMSAFAIAENTPLRLTRSILWMPFPYSAVLPLTAWLHDDRALELTLMVVALALTFFLARFGSLALLTGMMLFNSFMVGVMADIPLNLCGKLFVVALVTSAAVLAARLLLCCPMPREDLLRTQRAFVVEARRVGDAAIAALDPDAGPAAPDAAVKRMRRSLRRLNITTVTIDGRLAQPEVAADPHTAELLHQYLFDAELALQGIGQAVQRLARLSVPRICARRWSWHWSSPATPRSAGPTRCTRRPGSSSSRPVTSSPIRTAAPRTPRPRYWPVASAICWIHSPTPSRTGSTSAGTRRGRGRRSPSGPRSRWNRTARPEPAPSPGGSRRPRN